MKAFSPGTPVLTLTLTVGISLLAGMCAAGCSSDEPGASGPIDEADLGDDAAELDDSQEGDAADFVPDPAPGEDPAADDEGDGSGGGEVQDDPAELIDLDDTGLPFEPAGPDAAPDPMARGPFPVGVMTIDLEDESRREWLVGPPRFLRTEIWYPATAEAREGPFWTYDFHDEVDEHVDLGDQEDEFMAADVPGLSSTAVRGASIDREHGPYPVILFSHGAYSLRFEYLYATEHLASHGYIVVAPDHQGNTTWDAIRDGFSFVAMMAQANNRVQDMSFLLDELQAIDRDPEHVLSGTMDLIEVGATGHSYGGFTAAVAPCKDSGIRVSVLMAPVMDIVELYGCDLADYPVPVMIMGGTEDQTVSYESQYCGYRSIEGSPKYLYELERGGHFTFSDLCRLDFGEATLAGAPDIESDGCSETDNAPYEEAQQTIDHYATAFFNLYLRNSPGSAEFLVDYSYPPFDPVTFRTGDVPDWPDGGCSSLPF